MRDHSVSKKPINLWMLRFNDAYQFSIVKNVIETNTKISLLSGSNETLGLLSKFKQNKIIDVDFINNNEACALQFKTNSISENEKKCLFLNDNFYKAYYVALQVLERNEKFSGDLSFEERNFIIYQQMQFWSEKIALNRPSSIIFMDLPHMYYELILIALCEVEKIPCLIISYTPNHRKTVFLNGKFELIEGYKGQEFNETHKDYFSMAEKNLEKDVDLISKNDYTRISFLVKKFLSLLYTLLFNDLKRIYKNGYYIRTGFFKTGFNTIFSEKKNEFLYAWNSIYFRFLYKKISTPVDLTCDYVYLPLVSGFENTFHPAASPLNIYIILDFILKNTPEDCLIFVKEHPAQFKFRHHQRFSRSRKMYEKIMNMDRVRLINIDTNPYDLIINSRFVTGSSMSSSAYQAIALKKIYRYYGPHILPSKFAFPLFGNLPIIRENPKSFHEEKGRMGSELDSKSIASKIIDWSSDQINT
mgnify:CR=1 FL=1